MRVAYMRASLCLAGELVLCVRRICMVSVDGAYALAVLAIDALGESVSLSNHDRIWEVMTQQDRRNNARPIT
jgi:uncharacterized membrane protein